MNSSRCPRAWQAEAVEDRRLSRADQASFKRHLDTCRECATESAELLRLRQLAERLPALVSTPLRRRFLHHELLRRANAAALGTTPPNVVRKRIVLMLSLALCALAGSFVVVQGLRQLDPSRPVAATDAPRYQVIASAAGHFRIVQPGRELRIALSPGSFVISVEKLHAGQSFRVNLPDGELEVRGTRFRVEVEAKTRSVSVSEGLVALRLHGQPERMLGAGDSWQNIPPEPVGSPPTVAPAASTTAPAPSATLRRSAASSASAAIVRRPSEGASEFTTAMATFSRGDFATAEQLFVTFEARHPQSAHVEDTLFLRALCRLRRGDESGASAIANEYLRRYPSGFRAKDAERMTR